MIRKNCLFFILLIVYQTSMADKASKNTESIYGTDHVTFGPVQVAGELQGCSLMFGVTQQDQIYKNGKTIIAIGNLLLLSSNSHVNLTFKLGLIDNEKSSGISPPNFAYLQTHSFSTAKAKQASVIADDGSKLFNYPLFQQDVWGAYSEIIANNNISIGFNMQEGGVDINTPIDLTVASTEYTDDETAIRKRSYKALDDFTACSEKLIDKAHVALKKEEKGNTSAPKDTGE